MLWDKACSFLLLLKPIQHMKRPGLASWMMRVWERERHRWPSCPITSANCQMSCQLTANTGVSPAQTKRTAKQNHELNKMGSILSQQVWGYFVMQQKLTNTKHKVYICYLFFFFNKPSVSYQRKLFLLQSLYKLLFLHQFFPLNSRLNSTPTILRKRKAWQHRIHKKSAGNSRSVLSNMEAISQ